MDSIRIKRGLSKDLPANLPLGELAFCTDTQELWVGTGSSTPLKKVKDSELEQTNAQLSTNIIHAISRNVAPNNDVANDLNLLISEAIQEKKRLLRWYLEFISYHLL